jgi:tetratricopeptide (TPR) repeat protein
MHFRCSKHIFYIAFLGVLWAAPLWAKPSLVKQSIAAFEREEFSEARVCIDKAMEEAATQTQEDAWYYRGVIYEKILRNQIATEEAGRLFEEVLNAYFKVVALAPVASQYQSFAQINLNGLWAYYLDRGRRCYKQEDFESAIRLFTYCKQLIPGNLDAYLYTAVAAHQHEAHDVALRNYTHYLESAVVVPAAVYRGLAHLTAHALKHPIQALEILAQALLQHPFDNDLRYEQLQLYTNLGQVDVERERLKKRIAATPYEAVLYYQLGYGYEQQAQWQQALKQYQKAAELAPNSVEPVRQQGIVYYNQAVQATQEITKMSEEQFQEVGVQRIEKLENDLVQALPYFEQASTLSPREPFILKHLQTIYLRLRKPVQAKKIERCLRKYRL